MRRMKVPPTWRVYSQLKNAVRALPRWSMPVGAGENRARTLLIAASVREPPARTTAFANRSTVAEQGLRDHDPLHLVGALVDLGDLRVAHETLGREIARVAG